MGNWTKVVVLLIILTLGVAFGGYMGYRSQYVKPRTELAEKRASIQQSIDEGKATSENCTKATQQLQSLYTRSFPTNRVQAGMQYQLWLSQMLEFCNVREPKVVVGKATGLPGCTSLSFGVSGEFSLLDLTQFLYEFYWTPFLHRITALDIQPQEQSDLLKVSMTIEGLTIVMKADPNQKYPLVDKLPLETEPIRQLSSGPFAAYSPLGNMEIFRAVRTGVDASSYAQLTGTPIVTDETGRATKFALWSLGTEDRTVTYKVGDRMRVGAFDATVLEIDSDGGMVVLKQNSGRLWAVPLGHSLSDAVAIPANLF